jgi:hypothetical protein
MTLRNFVTFVAAFDDDSEWTPSGDIGRPGGRAIAHAIYEALRERGYGLSDPVQHSFYGWAFAAGADGRYGFVLQFADPWLMICEHQGRSPPNKEEYTRLTQSLHQALTSDARYSDVRWFTRKEYDTGAAGAETPS